MLNEESIRSAKSAKLHHSADIIPSLTDCFCTEDDPAEDGKEEGNEDLEEFTPSGEKAEVGCTGRIGICSYLVGVFTVFTKKNKRKK